MNRTDHLGEFNKRTLEQLILTFLFIIIFILLIHVIDEIFLKKKMIGEKKRHFELITEKEIFNQIIT